MRFNKKLLIAIVAATLLMATLILGMTLNVSAEATEPTLEIYKCNLSFRESIAIKYAVKSENVTGTIKMLVWNESAVIGFDDEADYALGTQTQTLTTVGEQSVYGVICDVFDLTGVVAKQMTDVFYARACVEQGGKTYYSPVKQYSVAQYAHEVKAAGTNTDLINLMNNMLAYGASAQKYLNNYNSDWLATEQGRKVTVVGGRLANGLSEGFFKEGSAVTLKADTAESGNVFSHWTTSSGDTVSSSTVTLTADETYTAVYIKCSEGLKFASNDDGTCNVIDIGNCADTNVVIPAEYNGMSVVKVEARAFTGEKGITSVVIPDTVTHIGASAFDSCFKLSSVTLPAELITIADGAFADCSVLRSIVIPKSVTSVGVGVFAGCTGMTSIDAEDGNSVYYAVGNCLIQRDTNKLIAGCRTSVIPDGVEIIAENAFARSFSLTTINIPESVKKIDKNAFGGCVQLKTVNYGGSEAGWAAIEKVSGWNTSTVGYTVVYAK